MTGKIFIDDLGNGTSFIDEQQGDTMSETPRTDAERARIEAQLDGEPDNVDYVLDQMAGHAGTLERELTAARREHERLKAEVERLRAVVDGERSMRDALRVETQAAITRLTAERDDARAEIARLTDDTFPAGFTESRPSDEDIWREAFLRWSHVPEAEEVADRLLAEYRKRWPR